MEILSDRTCRCGSNAAFTSRDPTKNNLITTLPMHATEACRFRPIRSRCAPRSTYNGVPFEVDQTVQTSVKRIFRHRQRLEPACW